MKNLSFIIAMSFFGLPSFAQISKNPAQIYQWIHEQTQTSAFYRSGETIYTFLEQTSIMTDPCLESETVISLPIGYPLTNSFYAIDEIIPEDNINGYDDIWYRVSGEGLNQEYFEGYVWGGDIAKGWRVVDLSDDGIDEFVMLGVPANSMRLKDQKQAELRVIRNYELVTQSIIAGICVAEGCDNMPLLRMIPNQPIKGATMIEATIMPIHCSSVAGVYRTFSAWHPQQQRLEYVYGGNYHANIQMENKDFIQGTNICQFSHEDNQFNPVWDCRSLVKPSIPRTKKLDRA